MAAQKGIGIGALTKLHSVARRIRGALQAPDDPPDHDQTPPDGPPTIDLARFLEADFQTRLRLAQRLATTRLHSQQLAQIWLEVLRAASAPDAPRLESEAERTLARELMLLNPVAPAAASTLETFLDGGRGRQRAPTGIVSLVISCERHLDKARALREHLGRTLEPTLVIVGDPTLEEARFDSGHVLRVPAEDTYEALPSKVMEAFLAVRRRFGAVGVLKIDDDCIPSTHPDPLAVARALEGVDYGGQLAGHAAFDRCWHLGKARDVHLPVALRFEGKWAKGAVYFVGPKALELLVREHLFFPDQHASEIFEDKRVGDVLRDHGVDARAVDLTGLLGLRVIHDVQAPLPEIRIHTGDPKPSPGRAAREPAPHRPATSAAEPPARGAPAKGTPPPREHEAEPPPRSRLDVRAFLSTDLAGRLRLAQSLGDVRLHSDQLSEIWARVLRENASMPLPQRRRLQRELVTMDPERDDARAALDAYLDGDVEPRSPRVVYLVVSCEPYLKKRARPLRAAIARTLRPTYIVLGDPTLDEARFDGKFLRVPAPDTYEDLRYKILEALVAVRRRHGRAAVLKIDDDCVAAAPPDPRAMLAAVEGLEYAGRPNGNPRYDRYWHYGKTKDPLGPCSHRFRGKWASGGIYYLGPGAVEHLVRDYLRYPGEFASEIYEDKLMGTALRAHGIEVSRVDLVGLLGITMPEDEKRAPAPYDLE